MRSEASSLATRGERVAQQAQAAMTFARVRLRDSLLPRPRSDLTMGAGGAGATIGVGSGVGATALGVEARAGGASIGTAGVAGAAGNAGVTLASRLGVSGRSALPAELEERVAQPLSRILGSAA